jgi:hypothetical protein
MARPTKFSPDSEGACGPAGARAPAGVREPVRGDPLGGRADRLPRRNAPRVGAAERRGDGVRPGVPTEDQTRVAALEREVKELRRANEILKKAAAFFAQAELDRRGI